MKIQRQGPKTGHGSWLCGGRGTGETSRGKQNVKKAVEVRHQVNNKNLLLRTGTVVPLTGRMGGKKRPEFRRTGGEIPDIERIQVKSSRLQPVTKGGGEKKKKKGRGKKDPNGRNAVLEESDHSRKDKVSLT